MAKDFASTTGGAVLIALIIILAVIVVPCLWIRVNNGRRRRREEERQKKREISGSAIELPELERGTPNTHIQPTIPPPIHPRTAPTETLRVPEMDPSGTTVIPAYADRDSQPLSQREQGLVEQINAMALKIRSLESHSGGESRDRPPEYHDNNVHPRSSSNNPSRELEERHEINVPQPQMDSQEDTRSGAT
ncbi:hypothetical protein PM082_014948 [Marasmius tenuissimus]|nr:hypothetical protein PM082_014948 [Marasmius tenuissimus]